MNEATPPQPGDPPGLHPEVVDALTQFDTAIAALAKATDPQQGRLGSDPMLIMDFARRVEGMRRRLMVVDQHLVTVCDTNQAAAALSQRTTLSLLADALQLSAGEAGRRVRAAHALSARTTQLGVPLEPVRPELSRAVEAGEVSAENTDLVLRTLDLLQRSLSAPAGAGLDPAKTGLDLDQIAAIVDVVEHDLVVPASILRPEELRTVCRRVVECYDPDGQVERDRKQEALRELRIYPNRDGGYSISGRLTGEVGAMAFAVMSPLARPRPTATAESGAHTDHNTADDLVADEQDAPTGRRRFVAGERDLRTAGQRWHDAFADLLHRASRAGGLPASGGTPATVIITISLTDLLAGTGWGTTTDGTLISTAKVREIIDEADVHTAYTTRRGEVLQMGRACRIATRTQTLALIARDGGCSFPGCDHPPEWCQRHHIRAWIDGGPTNLSNLTLVCGYHHRDFEHRGWTCTLIHGLPHWTPPEWIDPHQRPQLHHRIRLRQMAAGVDGDVEPAVRGCVA